MDGATVSLRRAPHQPPNTDDRNRLPVCRRTPSMEPTARAFDARRKTHLQGRHALALLLAWASARRTQATGQSHLLVYPRGEITCAEI
jgi:hypothetical protein